MGAGAGQRPRSGPDFRDDLLFLAASEVSSKDLTAAKLSPFDCIIHVVESMQTYWVVPHCLANIQASHSTHDEWFRSTRPGGSELVLFSFH